LRDIRCLLALTAITLGGCAFDSLVMADDSSFSRGPSRFGALHHPTELPAAGEGYWIPPIWSDRGLNYGIDELVGMLVHVGRTLELQDEGLVLGVGDLSRPSGGRSPWHRSHQTGRDVDLLFFVRDQEGKRVRSQTMFKHGIDGTQRGAGDGATHVFDVAANWLMVAALLDNPIAEVQYIFIQDDLRQLLLEHAMKIDAPRSLIARAAEILRQPSDSAPHNDHVHVRIFCPKSDLNHGCVDFGQLRWHKRDYKYASRLERLKVDVEMPEGVISALPWLLR
jgi:penicillin-insensitive murein endopeptidase